MSLGIFLLKNVPYFLTLSVNAILATLVLRANTRNPINRWLAAVIIAICVWITSLFFLYNHEFDVFMVFWGRIAFSSTNALCLFLFLFAYHFPSKSVSLPKVIFWAIIYITSLTIILGFTRLIINDVDLVNNTPYPKYGILFILFIISFVSCLAAAFYLLIRKYSNERGYERNQILYIFLGFFLSVFFAFITNLVVPTLTGDSSTARLGPLTTLILIGFATYSILRYRFLDIHLIVRRSLIYSLLFLTTLLFFALIAVIGPNVILNRNEPLELEDLLVVMLLTFFIVPLQRLFERLTDNFFFKARYDTQQTMLALSKNMAGTIDLRKLEDRLVSTIDGTLRPAGISLWLFDQEADFGYRAVIAEKRGAVAIKPSAVATLTRYATSITRPEIIVTEEMNQRLQREGAVHSWDEKFVTILNENAIAVFIPLVYKDEWVGMLLLQEKKSQDAYSNEDIRLLDLVSHQAAMAIDNARLYTSLEQRVQERTEQLEEANRHLKKLDKAKTEFLSIASHQLRTPLSAIRGYLSLLIDGDYGEVSDTQKTVLGKTSDNVRRLVALVNDLLSLARIEAGTGPKGLNLEDVNFVDMVDVMVDELMVKARNKNIKLVWERPEQEIVAEVDKEKMEQVVMNLIDNAINYTLTGSVTVRLTEDKKGVTYSVQDTGIGIDKDNIDNLFAKFYRTQDAIKVRPDGTGIGLYLCKTVVESHQGKVWVESEAGKGSTFFVQLPKKQLRAAPAAEQPEDAQSAPATLAEGEQVH